MLLYYNLPYASIDISFMDTEKDDTSIQLRAVMDEMVRFVASSVSLSGTIGFIINIMLCINVL